MYINMKARFKNIMFYVGLVSVVFAAAGIDFVTLTSWDLLIEAIVSIFANPVSLVSVIMCILSIICDTSTSGLGDKR